MTTGPFRLPPAFVLGLGPNGYGQVQSLVRAGVRVVGFHYSEQHFGRASRLAQSHHLDRHVSAQALAALLIERAAPFGEKPALIAASDEFAFLLSQRRDQLTKHFAYHWISDDTSSVVFDKPSMVRLCEQASICTPRTHMTRVGEHVDSTASEFCFPCVVKPVRSFRTHFPGGQKNYVAASAGALVAFYRRHPYLLGTTLWQEVIEGPDDDIHQCNILITQSGVTAAVCGVRKLRQFPPGYGNMCFGRTEANDTVASKSLALLRLLGYRGLASIEFKRRTRDNQYYFIEMNPRLPRYCSLFAHAGLNLTYLGYLDLVRATEGLSQPNPQRENAYWLAAGEDLKSYRADGKPRHSLLRWLQSIAKARAFAWWNISDPGPFICSVVSRFQKVAPHETSRRVVRMNSDPLRRAFERQYDNPHQVAIGTDTACIYDIVPPHPQSRVPILFCPGWIEDPRNHKETVYALYMQGRRTVFPDSPHGIEARPRAHLPMAQLRHAEALIAALKHRGIYEADAIAHSAGAISLAIAATARGGPSLRNVVLHSPAGLCGGETVASVAWRAWQERRQETRRQRCKPTERQVVPDPGRRRLYWLSTLTSTLAEINAIAHVDVWTLLIEMRRRGVLLAAIHGTDDRLFSMERIQQRVDVRLLDGFYSVEGGHQQLLLEPSRHGRLASEALLALERRRLRADNLRHVAIASMQNV